MLQFAKANNNFSVGYTLSSDHILSLVLMYLEKHPKVKPEELNMTFIRNIVKEMLLHGGMEQLNRVPPEILIKKQDLLVHVRGMVLV